MCLAQDVLDVAPSQLVPHTLKTVKNKRAAAHSMVGEPFEHDAPAIQEHENEPAEVVIVCEPEGTSLMMGGLHPRCVGLKCEFWSSRVAIPLAGV
jgi:hypothetical protein